MNRYRKLLSHVKLDAQHTEHISTIAEKGHCYLKTTKIRYYIWTYLISLLYEKALFEKTPFITAIFVTVCVREESEIISNVGVGTVRQSPVELDKVVDHMAYLSVTVSQAITQLILKITIVIVISLVQLPILAWPLQHNIIVINDSSFKRFASCAKSLCSWLYYWFRF